LIEPAKANHWIQLIGIFGVLAGLVFLGFEIQQNTRAVQNESYLSVMALLIDHQSTIIADEKFSRIVMIGEDSPADLSPEEWYRFSEAMLGRLGVWEYLYLGRQEGSVTDTTWAAYEPYYLGIICKPGYKRWLGEYGTLFAPSFTDYLDTTVLLNCVD
jgi:hypothetical protein